MRAATTAAPLDDYLKIDVRQLSRDGYLEEGCRKCLGWRVDGEIVGPVVIAAGSDCVEIFDGMSTTGQRWFGASVHLTETSVTYGTRRWFVCPECDRRCALLYIVSTQTLVCRVCLGAPYLSASLGKSARLQERRWDARRALFMDADGDFHRPKGMHQETWLRRKATLWKVEMEIIREVENLNV